MAWQRDYQWEQAIVAQYGSEWHGERPKAFRKGNLAALLSRDEITKDDLRWHVSVQHQDRIPKWEEFAAAIHELRPGVAFVIGIPPRSWWINVHPHVLHAYEVKDEALVAQWRMEARGDRPT